MYKKLTSLALCLMMMLAFVSGCASDGSSTAGSSTPPSGSDTGTSEPSTPDPAPAAGDTTATAAVYADTTTGGVMGYNENGINYFWGIPYAKAERFMPPEAYDSWEGYRVCWTIGEAAPQNDSVSPFDFMPNSMQIVEDEANLFKLQIQSPDLDPASPKPVVVWMHGGGYTTGASMEFDMYSGANLAEYGDVVFVGVNHRLNVLGFMDMSAYGDEYKYSGNVGILDLEFALKWVQDNIEAFGGDPNNVTIVGQSGGGSKVTTLMSMPSASELFHKAAAFSGGSAQITRDTESARAETEAALEILGITEENIDELKTIPYEELYAAANEAGMSYGPVMDGDLIPTGNFEISAGKPFMAGSVLGEFSTNIGGMATHNQASPEAFDMNSLDLPEEEVLARLEALYGEGAQQILDAFREAYPGHKDAGVLYMNDRFGGFMVPSRLLEAMNGYGGTGYQYVQAYVYPMFGGVVPIHTASCIPFWFNNMEYIPAWIAGDETAANRVSDQMAGALASFAYSGNPSQDGLEWEAWTAENGAVMVFDTESSVRYHHDDAVFELMAEYKVG